MARHRYFVVEIDTPTEEVVHAASAEAAVGWARARIVVTARHARRGEADVDAVATGWTDGGCPDCKRVADVRRKFYKYDGGAPSR